MRKTPSMRRLPYSDRAEPLTSSPHDPTHPGPQAGMPASGPGHETSGGGSAPTTGFAPAPGSAAALGSASTAWVPTGVPRLPSLRVTAALAAIMLALGVAVGAAIGPAPDTSFAGASLVPTLLRSLAARSAAGAARTASVPSVQPPPVASRAT